MSGFWFNHYSRALGCYLVTSRVSDDLFRAAVSQIDSFSSRKQALLGLRCGNSGISSQRVRSVLGLLRPTSHLLHCFSALGGHLH